MFGLKFKRTMPSVLIVSMVAVTGTTWSEPATTTIALVPLSPPANDDIASAVLIGSLPYTGGLSLQEITDSTESGSDPVLPLDCYGGGQGYRTVWYKYVAGLTGSIFVDTFSSTYDTVLAIWHGSPGSLIISACGDDVMPVIKQSMVEVWVTQGTTYYFEVTAFSAVDTGSLTIHARGVPYQIYLPLVLHS